ncbi:MAG TPA: hypothetical protein VF755_02035 [Catenuloplanes sp.]|jgi:hypothetical protein
MTTGHTWYDTLQIIGQARFTDLLVPTTNERRPGGARAAALFGRIYLEMAGGYLRLASVDNDGGLEIRAVETLGPDGYADADDEPGTRFPVSLSSTYFGDSESVRCATVNYVTNDDSDLSRGVVRCVELTLGGDHRIFFDPIGANGIRIGHAGAMAAWLRHSANRRSAMQRHTWSPPVQRRPSG